MKRLEAALSLVPNDCVLADVGCDHGLLCLAALQSGKAKKAYACDISAKSLEKARRALKDKKAECIVSDGLKNVPRDFTAITVCGMGAETMLGILSEYDGAATLILQPQTQAKEVRKTLTEKLGYRLIEEITACERNRYYPVMRFEKGGGGLDDLQLSFGLHAHNPTDGLIKMCEMLKKKYSAFKSTEQSKKLLAEIERVLKSAEHANNQDITAESDGRGI